MSYASWVVRRSMSGLETVEVVAEKDILRCQKKIDNLNDRIAVDRAMISFTRESRVVMSEYVSEIADIESDAKERKAKAGTRLLENLPAKPRVKGVFRRRLVAPTAHAQQHATA